MAWILSRLTIFLSGSASRALFFVMIMSVFSGCLPAFGLWLPWATEEQKVKRALNDIWQALIANDQAVLKQRLAGDGVKFFIDQERQRIKSFGIKSYECRIKSIKIDPATRAWAFVEQETVAKLANGKEMAAGTISVLQKIKGEWKLLTGYKTRNQPDRSKKKENPLAFPGERTSPSAPPPASVPGPQ